MAAWKRLTGRRRDLGLWRTRDELYAEARAIGIHGRGGMTKVELASAIRRATAPTRAFILVQVGRRRAAAAHARMRATLASSTRLAHTMRMGLAPALTASWRFHGRTLSIPVALLAVVVGGAMPVLVYGMSPKSTERPKSEIGTHALEAASGGSAVARSSTVGGREQAISNRRAHGGSASPTPGTTPQGAAVRSPSSSSAGVAASHTANAAVQSATEPAWPDQGGMDSGEGVPSTWSNYEPALGKLKNKAKHGDRSKHGHHGYGRGKCDQPGAGASCVDGHHGQRSDSAGGGHGGDRRHERLTQSG